MGERPMKAHDGGEKDSSTHTDTRTHIRAHTHTTYMEMIRVYKHTHATQTHRREYKPLAEPT